MIDFINKITVNYVIKINEIRFQYIINQKYVDLENAIVTRKKENSKKS